MGKQARRNKSQVRSDCIPCREICPICNGLLQTKSKVFNSNYALKYHLTTEHDREDEIESGITVRSVLQTSRAVTRALEWKMFVDLPRQETRF